MSSIPPSVSCTVSYHASRYLLPRTLSLLLLPLLSYVCDPSFIPLCSLSHSCLSLFLCFVCGFSFSSLFPTLFLFFPFCVSLVLFLLFISLIFLPSPFQSYLSLFLYFVCAFLFFSPFFPSLLFLSISLFMVLIFLSFITLRFPLQSCLTLFLCFVCGFLFFSSFFPPSCFSS